MMVQVNRRPGRLLGWLSLMIVLSLLLMAANAQPVDPLGGQVYDYLFTGQITGVSFSQALTFDKNQVVSILLDPDDANAFRGKLIFRAGNTLIDDAEAQNRGDFVLLQSLPINSETFSYNLEVRTLDVPGSFRVTIFSSALEEEPYTGQSNNTTPQNIDASCIAFGSAACDAFGSVARGVARRAVRGELADALDEDVYSFRLSAGEHFELALSSLGTGVPEVELLNPGGQKIDLVPVTSANVDRLLAYDVPSDGTYFARVKGGPGPKLGYDLVLVRGGIFSREPNAAFASTQLLTGMTGSVGGVLGSVNVPPLTDKRSLSFNETPLQVYFSTKGTFAYGAGGSQGLRLNNHEYLRTGIDQLSSFTYCYGQGAARTCPIHQNNAASLNPAMTYTDTLTGEHFYVIEGASGPLHYSRVIRWRRGGSRLVVTTRLTNTGTQPLAGVQALESINPNPNGVSDTNNDVLTPSGALPEAAEVWRVAQSTNAHGSLVMGTNYGTAAAGFLTGDIGDPNLILLAAPGSLDPNGASANTPMHLAFDLGDVPAGSRTDFTFVIALGVDETAALNEYKAAQPHRLILGLDDLYAVDLAAGKALVLETLVPMRANENTYRNNLDPVLKVYNEQGSLVWVNDDCGDDPANFDCPSGTTEAKIVYPRPVVQQGGRYYVQVTNSSKPSLFGPSSSAASRAGGEYVLLVSQSGPPTLAAIPNQTGRVGEKITVDLNASDPDGDELVYSLGAGAPAGAVINSTTRQLEWTPTSTGNYAIEVIVHDLPAGLQARTTFQVSVSQKTFLPGVTRN